MIPAELLRAAIGAEVLVPGVRESYTGFAHDSRMVAPGDCFVAVRGMHGDGHDYALDALRNGASAVLVERARIDALDTLSLLMREAQQAGVAVLVVADSREALRTYAARILAEWRPTVIAVAGSTGKTTTKEAIADVLALIAPTFRSWRNYNDNLGLPLSLGRLERTHQFAVMELGADHPGEIAELCALVHPRVGVITNVSATHLQYFTDVAHLRAELAQLAASLPADGLAVLNSDDEATRAMAQQTRARVVTFAPLALESDAPSKARDATEYVVAPLGTREPLALTLRPLPTAGAVAEPLVFAHLHADHWAYAVLAALAVGEAFGVSSDEALHALQELRPLPGRLTWLAGVDGLTLLDDSHNAAPASAAAGLRALAAIAGSRHGAAIAVLGDMLRLGTMEETAHRELGRAAAAHATYLVTRGTRAETIADGAIQAGMPRERIAVTHAAEDAAQAVRRFAATAAVAATADAPLTSNAVVYIKGSEELRMEQVTALLLAQPEQAGRVLDRQSEAWQRMVVMRPDRPTWLEVDLSVIGRNTQLVKALVGPDVRVLVSLKADAYGHGAHRVARTVLHNGAEWLGVATVSEGEPLRAAGIVAPILVFGYTAPWQAREAVRLDLRTTVYGLEPARALSRAAQDLGREARVHVKIDTGMARLGLRWEDRAAIVAFCAALRALPGVVVEGVFTHFATADSEDTRYAQQQLKRFQSVLAALDAEGLRPPIVHAANSAALLTQPGAWFDMVRPGVAIYGLAPSEAVRLPAGFQPALAFKTQVAQVKDVPPGEGIGYGATYVTTQVTRVATLPVGYADGFRRAPSNWGEVLVRGQRAPLLGRVSMDQCVIDVTAIPGVRQGDEVVLIGQQGSDELTAEAVAKRLGTISYEVVAELLARVPRIS